MSRRVLFALELAWYAVALVVIVTSRRDVAFAVPSWRVEYWVMVGLAAFGVPAVLVRWWRPRWTSPVALVVCAAALVTALARYPDPLTPVQWMFVGAVVPVLLAAVARRGRLEAVAVAALLVVASAVVGVRRQVSGTVAAELAHLLVGNYPTRQMVLVVALLMLLFPLALGLLLRSTDAGQRAERLARLRAEERLVVARELHDLVANHVSAMVVSAQAIEVSEDASTMRRCGEMVTETGHRALRAMARMVDALRYPQPDDDVPSSRWLLSDGPESIGSPVGAVRAAIGDDTRVRLRMSDQRAELGPDDVDAGRSGSEVLIALHRIGVEALTNARRHGTSGSIIDVELAEREPATVVLEVVNEVPGDPVLGRGGGHGLLGLRERALAVGGDLEAGPDGAGRWRLRAELPWSP